MSNIYSRMERRTAHFMPRPVYGIMILLVVWCHFQTATSKYSGKPKKPRINLDPDTKKMQLTVTWPFSRSSFTHPIQSPVDIITAHAKDKNDCGDTLMDLKVCDSSPEEDNRKANVYNTGTTVEIVFHEVDHSNLPHLEGGPLMGKYVFEQMHFHWGITNDWGSEHFIDGEAFAVEIHIIYFKKEYKDIHTAAHKPDGLAQLTIFAEATSQDNELLDHLHKIIDELTTANLHKPMHWNEAMQWALSGVKTNSEYYAYPGSQTVPPYAQNVVHIVLPTPITLSFEQLAAFRELHSDNEHHILANKRKLHPLYHRPILRGRIDSCAC